jgi:hypothetical protein
VPRRMGPVRVSTRRGGRTTGSLLVLLRSGKALALRRAS